MTEVTIYRNSEDKYIGFESKGHANFRKAGKDIVCAAISILTVNCANSIEEIAHVKCDVTEGDGYLKVTVRDFDNDNVQLFIESLKLGLTEIQKDYPKNLKLTIGGVDHD